MHAFEAEDAAHNIAWAADDLEERVKLQHGRERARAKEEEEKVRDQQMKEDQADVKPEDVRVTCPLCKRSIPKGALALHQSLCPARVVACKYCALPLAADRVAFHERACHDKPWDFGKQLEPIKIEVQPKKKRQKSAKQAVDSDDDMIEFEDHDSELKREIMQAMLSQEGDQYEYRDLDEDWEHQLDQH